MIVIRNGTVLTEGGWRVTDVTIDDGLVVSLETAAPPRHEGLDATGRLVGPAFVDLHTHLREPGQTWKEDIASGGRAAVAGGYGAIVAMPNTDPPIDSPKVAEMVASRGEEVGLVDVIPSGALTRGRAGVVPSDLAGMHEAGIRLFTDDGDTVGDPGVLRDVMVMVAGLPGALVAQHAEDRGLTGDGHIHEGEISRRLGLPGIPAAAEADVVARDLELVADTRARYHCQHVSSALTVELIRRAKDQRLPVTAEVAPHHLTFDETALEGLDTDFKMYPPLRSPGDRESLVAALRSGIIDVVATDHAPHTNAEKAVDFAQAPRGVIGLETAASATWAVLGDRDRFFGVMSVTPARIAGLTGHGLPVAVGKPANLVVFDPAAEWSPLTFESKSSNSPYRGRQMVGRVDTTFRRGVVVFGGQGRAA